MNEEAKASSDDGASKPVLVREKTTVTQILGAIEIDGVEIEGAPVPNNTRWVFDVRTSKGGDTRVQLLDWRSRRHIAPELMSFYFVPMNDEAHDARVIMAEKPNGVLVINTEETSKPALFRVGVDVMHSANR